MFTQIYELAYVNTAAPTMASVNAVALFQADALNPLYSIPIAVITDNGGCSTSVCLCLINSKLQECFPNVVLQTTAGLPSTGASIRTSFYYGAGKDSALCEYLACLEPIDSVLSNASDSFRVSLSPSGD